MRTGTVFTKYIYCYYRHEKMTHGESSGSLVASQVPHEQVVLLQSNILLADLSVSCDAEKDAHTGGARAHLKRGSRTERLPCEASATPICRSRPDGETYRAAYLRFFHPRCVRACPSPLTPFPSTARVALWLVRRPAGSGRPSGPLVTSVGPEGRLRKQLLPRNGRGLGSGTQLAHGP